MSGNSQCKTKFIVVVGFVASSSDFYFNLMVTKRFSIYKLTSDTVVEYTDLSDVTCTAMEGEGWRLLLGGYA